MHGYLLPVLKQIPPQTARGSTAPVPPLRGPRRGGVGDEELRDGGYQLCRGKGLLQKDTAGDTFRRPFVASARGHVEDRQFGCDLPRLPSRFPAVRPIAPINIDHERPVVRLPILE